MPASVTEEPLRDALFSGASPARTLLVFVEGRPVGYATYFFSFSSMMGRRALWLDDLFIDSAFRGKGIGKALTKVHVPFEIDERAFAALLRQAAGSG